MIDSVTKNFYDFGWRGLNIEPSASFFPKLREQRPEDVNLCVAVGSRAGDVTFFEFEGADGLSTIDKSVAEAHQANGYVVHERLVPLATLDAICEEQRVSDIHFVKIDVEGAEAEVLQGFDLSRWRPWILLVEATAPTQSAPSHEVWEPQVLASGYRFAYFDGLNRYYVHEEKADLIPILACQPNVFDDFVSRRLANVEIAIDMERERSRLAETAAEDFRTQLVALQAESARVTASLSADLARYRHDAERLQAEIEGLYRSTSWKITAPLRFGVRLIRRALGR